MKILALCKLLSPLLLTLSREKPFGVFELRQFAGQSDRTWVIETGRNCVVEALMGALVIEDVAKIIEADLLCTER